MVDSQKRSGVGLMDQLGLEIEARRKAHVRVRRTREAINASVLAATIGIHGAVEAEIRAIVTRDDGLGSLGGQRGLDADRLEVLIRRPAVIEGLRAKALKAAGIVR